MTDISRCVPHVLKAALRTSLTVLFGVGLAACGSPSGSPEEGAVSPLAVTMGGEKVSRPSAYSGYSREQYDGYEMTSRYIPMRDGTRIAVDIFRPTSEGEQAAEQLPVLWMHTPYNRRNYGPGLTAENYPGKALKLAKYGYIVAVADFRGLYASFGRNAGFNRGEWQDHARWDAYDITEWLAAQPWSSGKVGMWGCSATGGSQMQALSTAPPSLKAVFPMSCEWDVYPFANYGGMAPPEGVPTRVMRGGSREARDRLAAPVDGDEDRSLLNAAIAEHENNIETAGYTPFRDSTAENFDSQWWLQSSPHTYKDTIEESGIAIYTAANLDEEGPGYGPPLIFNNLSNPLKFVLGPATHCDWTTVEDETGFDILVEELRFFDHWLKGVENGIMEEAPVTYYTYNLDSSSIGIPGWHTAETWPLPNQQLTEFKLGKASLVRDGELEEGATSVTVDYEVDHDNFWENGLQFVTAPLEEDVQITGHPVLKLWLSSTAQDADVVARIDDVAPDGTTTYRTVEGRLRASLRKTTEAPYNNLGLPYHPFTEASRQPLVPGEAVELEFDFYVISNVFKAGHQIRLTLNFADARATPRLEPAPDVTVHYGGEKGSTLILPVIPRES
ncbi:CocE/NonD family hydrolase [Gilvimarinus sp. F26214L]|uniref:CocE/NonD family hydrolase n=1 Tax=Gilvimarinus sp. DZF01 TaxID=3461371 RepID=UPI00404619FD